MKSSEFFIPLRISDDSYYLLGYFFSLRCLPYDRSSYCVEDFFFKTTESKCKGDTIQAILCRISVLIMFFTTVFTKFLLSIENPQLYYNLKVSITNSIPQKPFFLIFYPFYVNRRKKTFQLLFILHFNKKKREKILWKLFTFHFSVIRLIFNLNSQERKQKLTATVVQIVVKTKVNRSIQASQQPTNKMSKVVEKILFFFLLNIAVCVCVCEMFSK